MKNVEIIWRTLTDYALSGSSAAVHYLGGRNTVADLGRRIVHTTRTLSQGEFPAGDEVIILTEDPLADADWEQRTSA